MFFRPCLPPVVFGEGCGLGGGLGGFQAFRAPQGTTGHVAAGLGSLWGKAPKSPVIGRLVLRQGLRPLARLIVSTWTLFRLCFPRRRHLLRLDTRRSPPEQKKCRKNRGNRRVQLEDGVVVSVPSGQRPTPDSLPRRPTCSPTRAGTGDRLRLAGLALTDFKPLGIVPSPLPPAPAETLAETVGPVPQPRTRPLVLASSPPPSPPSSRRRGHRHDIVDRRLTCRRAVLLYPRFFLFPFSPFALLSIQAGPLLGFGFLLQSAIPFVLLPLCVHQSLVGSLYLV